MPKFFLSLPVADIKRSTAFFKSLGFAFNPAFTSDNSACLAISDTTSVMLAPRERFADLTKLELADPRKTVTGLVSLWFDTRAEVDALVEAALKAGGTEAHPAEDEGFMYQRAIYDLDGHGWGISWMDPTAMPPA